MSTQTINDILDAALLHVPFDGWSETTLNAALEETGIDSIVAHSLLPRGPVDLALAYHQRGDALMSKALSEADLSDMRFRDRVAFAVRTRLEVVDDKEAVRRGTTLFALPLHAADGAKAVWGTADRIWNDLGDTSEDYNWYTKRATLSGVYSSTLLYWLGDDSLDHQATWAFLDRRIDDVMQFEKFKGQVRKTPGLGALFQGAEKLFSGVRAPNKADDLPGHVTGR